MFVHEINKKKHTLTNRHTHTKIEIHLHNWTNIYTQCKRGPRAVTQRPATPRVVSSVHCCSHRRWQLFSPPSTGGTKALWPAGTRSHTATKVPPTAETDAVPMQPPKGSEKTASSPSNGLCSQYHRQETRQHKLNTQRVCALLIIDYYPILSIPAMEDSSHSLNSCPLLFWYWRTLSSIKLLLLKEYLVIMWYVCLSLLLKVRSRLHNHKC